MAATVSFPQSYLTSGNNTVRLELVNDAPGQTFDMIYVDWFEVGYGRTYAASGDSLQFGGDQVGAWQYRVTGFSTSAVEAYDITDPYNLALITGGAVIPEGGSQTLVFGDTQGAVRRYLALTTAQRLAPLSITADTPSNLQAASNGADYIIVTHSDFRDAAQRLATHRAAGGMRVKVVDVQDVYDEFGYGLMSAEAIRDFLAHAYTYWAKPAPAYVLLVGDGNYDFRRYLATSAPTYLPPYLEMADPDVGETATDNRFVAVTGSDILPDMHVGRFPANTAADASILVDKTIGWETTQGIQEWQRKALFVTDDLSTGGGDFYEYSDNIADGYADPPANTVKLLPSEYARTKVYMGKTCPYESPSGACRQQIVEAINTGSLLTSYIGHGTKTYWASEKLMDITSLSQLTNRDKLTIMLPMTCDNGYFAEPKSTDQSFGEASVRLSSGGAVANWAPTGFGLASGHDYLERGLFLALFHQGIDRLGAATTQSKLYMVATAPPGKYLDLIDTFLLLGDPGLKVPVTTPPTKRLLYLPLVRK